MSHLRSGRRARVLAAAAILLIAALSFGGSTQARAQNADSFTVRDVAVDVSAANAELARGQALIEGQREAFRILMRRLTDPKDEAQLPRPSDAAIVELVRDVGVDQEKRSTVRYVARLSVRFHADGVRRLLRTQNLAYVEWRGRPVTVVPVWREVSSMAPAPAAGGVSDSWRDAWMSPATQGVVPFAVPDQARIDAARAAAGPDPSADALAQALNTRDLLLVEATGQTETDGGLRLAVEIEGVGVTAPLIAGGYVYDAASGEDKAALSRRAVADIVRIVNDGYKAGNLLRHGRADTLFVLAPLDGALPGWLAVRERLMRAAPVRGYEMIGLSRRQAALVLHYIGDKAQLEGALAQNGLSLSWVRDHWEIAAQTAGAAPVIR